ncbi:conjugative transposon protein TraK [Flavobacterium sp. YJ01]|uniref:conjugative transposon protein TraK n=1 Tax=Flavobacterium sp. YJ01 TaxID=3031997 RepID=UPI0023E4060B|nr:conjugative transposon protein TraK [Flavobacterium sp. YJ01]WET03344.1 conjugative transposon protein TraK [Flavobacterium sp. YJ01]WET04095.1 conjugative transposon protein TraK [Flavobacterium sp. YJ01]
MFSKMKNIDTAFRHIRGFTMLVILCCAAITSYSIYKSFSSVALMDDKVYILANGKALEAFASDRKDNVPVEARDHVRTFHQFFFSLDPDDKVIKANVTKALYLADNSVKRIYDDLKENGYYSGIISGNISQTVIVDSVRIDINEYPYRFKCYARQNIIRTTIILNRNLITEGTLRNVSRSDNNPHGFLIERFNTLENKDLGTVNRKP